MMKKRIVCVLLCLVLLLGLAPAVLAAGSGSFCLFAATTSQTLIGPVRISYSSGQTIQQALDASGYSFERHGAFVDVIEGVEGGFLICYDGGGYDLSAPADTITAMIISENEGVREPHLGLLRYMMQYREMTNHVQNYAPAETAYQNAVKALRTGNAATAEERLQDLQNAVAEYESILNGPRYTVTVTATQNGTRLSRPTVTLTDAYGNLTSVVGTSADVPAGTYTVSVSDGTWNTAERTVDISGRTELGFQIPYGEWFGEIGILDQQRNARYDSVQDTAAHILTVQIPDTAGLISPVLNATQGSGIPDPDGTKLYGVYEGTDGVYYGNTQKSWSSNAASLSALIGQGMGERTFTLEARYASGGGETQIQSYTVVVQRIPTLSELKVTEENTALPLKFDPLTNSYDITASAGSVKISATPFGSAYSVDGTGTFAIDSDTTKTVTVRSGSRSNSYTVHIQKKSAVDVTLSVPSGTTAAVFNSADSEVVPVSGVYHLIPGEEYYYIATRSTWYHSREAFTASAGLTVTVTAPETADALSDFALFNGSSSSTRTAYAQDQTFSPSNHSLGCTVPDIVSVIYAQATPTAGYTVKAIYNRQTTNSSTNGTPYSVTINRTVGASSVVNLTGCLAAGGYSQNLTLRASRTDGNVTQYQDYPLLLRRREHLRSLSLSVGSEPVTLLNGSGAAADFERDITEYSVSVDRSVTELLLNAAFVNESNTTSACGGYYALVNGIRFDTLSGTAVPLDQQQGSETVTIEVCHADANAVSTTYTITVRKTDPVPVTFSTTPSSATVFVKDHNGKRISGDGKTFLLIPGQTYTYTVTASGYVGQQVKTYTAPGSAATVTVRLAAAGQNTSLPDYSAYWSSSRFDGYNNAVVDVRTPVTAEDAALYWATKVGEGYSSDACGCPIIVNGYMYTYAGNKLYKIDTVSGEILATGTMDHASSFAINAPTYAEGMIFVGLADGTIQAFNAATLSSVWIYHDELKGQPDCPIVYSNGYIYTGFWNGETAQANYVCLSVTDEDPRADGEEKLPTWTYASKGGFYWAGAYASDGYLLICTDDGSIGYTTGYARILSLDPLTGEVIDSYTMTSPGDLRSGVTFVPAGGGAGRGYFTSKGGYFYRIDVTAEGRFTAGSLKKIRLPNGTSDPNNPGMSVSTPTVYNGRAYVGVSGTDQFGQYSGHNITVIDLDSWSIAYSVPTQGYPQTSGVLTTAYSAETGSVNIYFFDNYTPGKLRMITDRRGQTSAAPVTVESYTDSGVTTDYSTGYVLFTPYAAQAQYAICSPIVDEYGTIYFKNDSAYMMAVGSTVTALEITTLPAKTSYEEGETFNASGMTVTATYSNGMTRDVTAYVAWSEQPLTAYDTQFQIYFPYMMYHDDAGNAGTRIESPFAVLDLTVGGSSAVLYGDADGDGVIRPSDATRILQYLVDNSVEIDLVAADADGDGVIRPSDATRILQYLVDNSIVLGPQ